MVKASFARVGDRANRQSRKVWIPPGGEIVHPGRDRSQLVIPDGLVVALGAWKLDGHFVSKAAYAVHLKVCRSYLRQSWVSGLEHSPNRWLSKAKALWIKRESEDSVSFEAIVRRIPAGRSGRGSVSDRVIRMMIGRLKQRCGDVYSGAIILNLAEMSVRRTEAERSGGGAGQWADLAMEWLSDRGHI